MNSLWPWTNAYNFNLENQSVVGNDCEIYDRFHMSGPYSGNTTQQICVELFLGNLLAGYTTIEGRDYYEDWAVDNAQIYDGPNLVDYRRGTMGVLGDPLTRIKGVYTGALGLSSNWFRVVSG